MSINNNQSAAVKFYHPRLDPKLTEKVNANSADLTIDEAARFLCHVERYCTYLSAHLSSLVPPEDAHMYEDLEWFELSDLSKEAQELYTESIANDEAAELLEDCIVKLDAGQQTLSKENRAYIDSIIHG